MALARGLCSLLLGVPGCWSPGTGAALPAAATTIDGETIRPASVPPASIQVLLFLAHDCPIANAYAPEIAAIARECAGADLRLFLVHVDPDLDADEARAHARDYGLEGLPILLDARHELARALGVTVTPEAAVLTAAGLQYRGRIDDRFRALGSDGQQPERRELRQALADLRAGREVGVPRAPAVGCLLPEAR
jgi:hypothetical protein